MKKNIIALIPARGGSKGLPFKNIRDLNGKPLIAYSIEQAKKSKLIDRVIVSTEDKEIAKISKQFGAEIIKRPSELAKDDIGTLPVLKHAINYLKIGKDYKVDILVVLQPTSPLRLVDEIDEAITKLIEDNKENYDSVVTLKKVPEDFNPHWNFIIKDGKAKIFTGEKEPIIRRQDLPKTYHRNGSIYVIRSKTLMVKNSIYGDLWIPFVSKIDYSISIDTEEDLVIARLLMKIHKNELNL